MASCLMEVFPEIDLRGTYKSRTDTEASRSFLKIIRQITISFTFLIATISDYSRSKIKEARLLLLLLTYSHII